MIARFPLFSMIILIIAIFTVVLFSCVKSHQAIHGTIINTTTTPNASLRWEGTVECYGRSLLDINSWYDKGLKVSSSKTFTAAISDDGTFTFPSSLFFSTLRKKEIHYSCTLTDSCGTSIGYVVAPVSGDVLFHLYTKKVTIDMVPHGAPIPDSIPDNIRIRITLRDKHAGGLTEEVPLQLFLSGYGFAFSRDLLVSGSQHRSVCSLTLSLVDEYKKLKSLSIPNGEQMGWVVNCDPGAPVTFEVPYYRLSLVLKAWPASIDSGEALNWFEAEDTKQNPPEYFNALKKSILDLPDD